MFAGKGWSLKLRQQKCLHQLTNPATAAWRFLGVEVQVLACVSRGQGSCHGEMDGSRHAQAWACIAQLSEQHRDVASSCTETHLSSFSFPMP